MWNCHAHFHPKPIKISGWNPARVMHILCWLSYYYWHQENSNTIDCYCLVANTSCITFLVILFNRDPTNLNDQGNDFSTSLPTIGSARSMTLAWCSVWFFWWYWWSLLVYIQIFSTTESTFVMIPVLFKFADRFMSMPSFEICFAIAWLKKLTYVVVIYVCVIGTVC